MSPDVVRQFVVTGLLVFAGTAPPVRPVAALRASLAPRPVTADFNGDGASDQVSVVRGRVQLALAHREVVELRGIRHVARLAAADVDRDGDTDLVALTRHGTLRIFRNDGQGRLSPVRPQPRSTGMSHSSNGTLGGHSGEDPPTETPLRVAPPADIARIGAFPVLARAGPGAQLEIVLRLTVVSPRSSRAPPLPLPA